MRQRPQFFIDLERELAGESVEEEAPRADESVYAQYSNLRPGETMAVTQDQFNLLRQWSEMDRSYMAGLEQATATGAMIAASNAQYQAQMLAQSPHPQLAYMARQQMQSSRDGYGAGSAFGSLGSLFGL